MDSNRPEGVIIADALEDIFGKYTDGAKLRNLPDYTPVEYGRLINRLRSGKYDGKDIEYAGSMLGMGISYILFRAEAAGREAIYFRRRLEESEDPQDLDDFEE